MKTPVFSHWTLRCTAAATILATTVAPAAGAILTPTADAVLHPGDEVAIRWTPPAADVRELELLLLLDGTARPVRLTEQLAPRDSTYHWRVPNLPSTAARLQIRFSRGRGEEMGSTSAAFVIARRRQLELAALGWRGGEWWVVPPGAGAAGGIATPRRRVLGDGPRPWPLEPLASQGAREPLPPPPRTAVAEVEARPRRRPRPAGARPASQAPSDIPQRE